MGHTVGESALVLEIFWPCLSTSMEMVTGPLPGTARSFASRDAGRVIDEVFSLLCINMYMAVH